MAFEPALAVDGALIPMSQMRRLLYQATNGNRGVTRAGDMRVTALTVPGGAVNINRGSGTAPSPWRPGESYGVAAANADSMDIEQTGSSGARTEYIVAKVRDHHYDSSQPPADPLNDTYTEFAAVPSLANLNFPYVPLAKLVIPANTAAIENSMITDIRKITDPIIRIDTLPTELVIADTETLTATRVEGEWFPNAGGVVSVDIPEDAGRVIIECQWNGLRYDAANGNGRLWVQWGDPMGDDTRENRTQEIGYDSPGATVTRTSLLLIANRYVPSKYRGKDNVTFAATGKRIDGPGPKMDALSSVGMRFTWLRVPD